MSLLFIEASTMNNIQHSRKKKMKSRKKKGKHKTKKIIIKGSKVNKSTQTCNLDSLHSNIPNEKYTSLWKSSLVYTILNNIELKENIKCFIGIYYNILHYALMVFGVMVIIFINNKLALCILLFIITLDAGANIVLHDCPLSMCEKKYLGYSGMGTRLEMLQKFGFMYDNANEYNSQLEVIFNAWIITALKILCLMIKEHIEMWKKKL